MKLKLNGYEVEGTATEVIDLLQRMPTVKVEKHEPSFLAPVKEKIAWDKWGELLKEMNEASKTFATNANVRFRRGEKTHIRQDLRDWGTLPYAEMREHLLKTAKKYKRTVASIISANYR